MVSVSDFVRFALDVFGKLQSVPTRIEALWRLAEIAGWDPAEVEIRVIQPTAAGFVIYQREVPDEWIDLATRRVAPAVLAADPVPYHRFAWQINPIECDLSTGEVLISSCPRCEANLEWNRTASVFGCSECQFDLRDHGPAYVPADRLSLARDLHGYLSGTADPLPAPFDALDDVSTAYAMEWLAFFADLQIGRFLKPSWNNAPLGLAEIRRWPDSFDAVLTRFLRESAAPFTSDRALREQMISLLTEAIQRAGTPPLRHVLLDRAIQLIAKSSLSNVAVANRIFGTQRDIRTSAVPRTYLPSLRELLRMDSMRAIQSATIRRPRGS
jgi:hypothetical protein